MSSATRTPYWSLDRIMRLLIALAVGAFVIWLVKDLSNVLLPFFVACFIAYMIEPLVTLNQKWLHTRGRAIPVFVTLLDVTIAICLLVYLFVPSIIEDSNMLGNILHEYSTGQKEMPPVYSTIVRFINHYFNPENIEQFLTAEHMETILRRGSSIIEESLGIVAHALEWMLTFIYVLFILIDYPEISRGFAMIIPRKYRRAGLSVVTDVRDSMNRYFRGQGMVALCAAVFYCAGFAIVGIPLAIPLGILVGVLYMIPYFQYVTIIPVAIVCFIYSLSGQCEFVPELGKCLLVYLFSQSVCDYIITPHVMGREMGLNPAVILLSLSVWGSLLGIIGMIIALPITALLMSYYVKYISEPETKKGQDQQSQPASDTSGNQNILK